MKRTLILLSMLGTIAHGFTLNDITHWTGTGSNRGALVVDFANGGPSFVWGFRFSGASTGLAMINAIGANPTSGLEVQITHYSFGDAVTGLRFGTQNAAGFDAGSPGFWGYYLGGPSLTAPSSWTESQVGAGDRALSNESWDGWAWAPNFAGAAPGNNLVAAPEPASLLGLGFGLILLRRKRA